MQKARDKTELVLDGAKIRGQILTRVHERGMFFSFAFVCSQADIGAVESIFRTLNDEL